MSVPTSNSAASAEQMPVPLWIPSPIFVRPLSTEERIQRITSVLATRPVVLLPPIKITYTMPLPAGTIPSSITPYTVEDRQGGQLRRNHEDPLRRDHDERFRKGREERSHKDRDGGRYNLFKSSF